MQIGNDFEVRSIISPYQETKTFEEKHSRGCQQLFYVECNWHPFRVLTRARNVLALSSVP